MRLIFSKKYLVLLLLTSCLYEISLTILDYELKLLSIDKYTPDKSPTGITNLDAVSAFFGHYGQLVNAISLVTSLVIFPKLQASLGVRRTLVIFPVLLIFFTLLSFIYPNLYVLFVSMAILKGLTYSLMEPSKELLYMPCSELVKYKAKVWIDVVGARFAKALASVITARAGGSHVDLVRTGAVPAVLCSLGLLAASQGVGDLFEDIEGRGDTVVDDEEEDRKPEGGDVWKQSRVSVYTPPPPP